jgi:protein TonB
MDNMSGISHKQFLPDRLESAVDAADNRKRNVMAALVFSLALHVCGGWIFLFVVHEAPRQLRIRPIEISVVTPPVREKAIVPARIPAESAPVPPAKPVAPPRPAPVTGRVILPQEMKTVSEKPVQPPQLSTAVSSQEKAPSVSQPAVMQQTNRAPARAAASPVAAPRTAAGADVAGLPVTGPGYDAAYLNNPAPPYPAAARKLMLQGTATVRVLVSPDGRPKSVRLENSSGSRILDEAALEAVQRWSFVPARRGDKPIAAEVDVPVRFRLN